MKRTTRPTGPALLILVWLMAWVAHGATKDEVRFPVSFGSIYRLEGTSDGERWTILEPAILGRAADWVRPRSQLPTGITDVRLTLEKVADLRPLLEKLREKYHIPALGALLIRSNHVIAAGVAGVRVEGTDAPAMSGDLWHQGSLTKSMTATVAATLVEEGRISWTTTLGEVLGPRVPEMHTDWRAVTLGQLLRHHGGAPDHEFLIKQGIWPEIWRQGGPMKDRRLYWLTAVTTNPPATKPGQTYVYSNTGYVFVGMMLEAVTGEAWENLMQARLFKPLGMSTAGFGSPGRRGTTNQPWGHLWVDGKAVGTPPGRFADNPPALGPAGTMHGSMFDLAKYLMCHANRGSGEGVRLLAPATFRRLQQPEPGETYAFGWSVSSRPWAGGVALNHTGSNMQWFSNAWIAPEKQAAIIAVTNIGDGTGKAAFSVTDEALSKVLATYLGR